MVDPNDIQAFMDTEKGKKEKPRKENWEGFIKSEVVAFFGAHGLEKLSVEDGNGNEAKLTRQKDDSIKCKISSTSIE